MYWDSRKAWQIIIIFVWNIKLRQKKFLCAIIQQNVICQASFKSLEENIISKSELNFKNLLGA